MYDRWILYYRNSNLGKMPERRGPGSHTLALQSVNYSRPNEVLFIFQSCAGPSCAQSLVSLACTASYRGHGETTVWPPCVRYGEFFSAITGKERWTFQVVPFCCSPSSYTDWNCTSSTYMGTSAYKGHVSHGCVPYISVARGMQLFIT
jgi:hypothetical protein